MSVSKPLKLCLVFKQIVYKKYFQNTVCNLPLKSPRTLAGLLGRRDVSDFKRATKRASEFCWKASSGMVTTTSAFEEDSNV